MLRIIYENIKSGQEVRKNLIGLRKLLKEQQNRMAFLYLLAGDYKVFYKLLDDEDAKVRKNVALIMGELGAAEFMDKLYEAYLKEEKLFVKSDYLVALSHFDYSPLIDELKERLNVLTNMEVEESNIKHINEEIKVLSEMLLAKEKPMTHKFIGYEIVSEVIMITNRDHQEVTLEQIKSGVAKTFNAGVLAKTKDLKELLKIRTYSELLFRIPGLTTVDSDPQKAAKAIYEGGLLAFLKERHEGEVPFYFRIEMKTKMALDKKSAFTKRLAAEIENISNRALLNSTSHYEVELRLIENKEGLFNVLIKLYTIKDKRFAYRKKAVATSIAPVNAALIAQLSKAYLKEEAQVLDPFCGVGTMLIERNKLVPANPMYGIDIYGDAIEKAIENANWADVTINFINRDFFDFKHDYLFDEIFTNMPAQLGRKTEDEIKALYCFFFNKALEVLKDDGIIIMYTRNKQWVEDELQFKKRYKLLKDYVISKKEGAYVYILQVNK